MHYQEVEENLDEWFKFRASLSHSVNSLEQIAEFWGNVKQIPFNHKIDPYHPSSWPSPWEIIADKHYDDLTVAIMIGYTIKLIEPYKDSKVEIRIQVDHSRTRLYNLVYVNDIDVLNYERFRVVKAQDIDDSFFIENMVELAQPR